MDQKTYDFFFQALAKIVDENVPVDEKHNALQRQMTEHDETNLQELAAWFGLTEG